MNPAALNLAARQLVWSHAAADELDALPSAVSKKIQSAVEDYARSGVGDVKRLSAVRPSVWRIRVGEYRATIEHELDNSNVQCLVVTRVFPRGDGY